MPALGRGASPGQGPGANRLLSLLTTGATQLTGAKLRKALLAQSCPTLRDARDWGPPGSSVHGIL